MTVGSCDLNQISYFSKTKAVRKIFFKKNQLKLLSWALVLETYELKNTNYLLPIHPKNTTMRRGQDHYSRCCHQKGEECEIHSRYWSVTILKSIWKSVARLLILGVGSIS